MDDENHRRRDHEDREHLQERSTVNPQKASRRLDPFNDAMPTLVPSDKASKDMIPSPFRLCHLLPATKNLQRSVA